MRIVRLLASGAIALAAAPVLAFASPPATNPFDTPFGKIDSRAAGDALLSFHAWLHWETKYGPKTPCSGESHQALHAAAASARRAADDEFLLAGLVRSQLSNPNNSSNAKQFGKSGASMYLTRAKLLSRQAAQATVRLRRCG